MPVIPIALRQMRVATRRMRAAWRYSETASAGARSGATWPSCVAWPVRWVRCVTSTCCWPRCPTTRALAPLADAWRQRRAAAREQLDRLLAGPEYEAFVDDYLALTGEHRAGVADDGRRRGRPKSTARRAGCRRRLRDAGVAALASGDDATWHALRIAVKRLRYTLETLRDVLDPQRRPLGSQACAQPRMRWAR